MLKSLDDVWHCVRGILCNDAPEGHIPDELDEDVELDTKDVLSYSWRALKEARFVLQLLPVYSVNDCSTLLRVVISKAPFQPDGDTSLLEVSDFRSLGKLCFTQLAELRHRGAFSTVAQTFAACCLRCTRTNHEMIRTLPFTWYQV